MIETSSVPPRKSSITFEKSPKNVRKRSPYLRNNFGKSSEIFREWSEIFGKSSKTSSLVCLCNRQNITCPLVDMNFIFCSTEKGLFVMMSLAMFSHSSIFIHFRLFLPYLNVCMRPWSFWRHILPASFSCFMTALGSIHFHSGPNLQLPKSKPCHIIANHVTKYCTLIDR